MPTTASAPSASSASTSCWLRMPPATMSWRCGELAQSRGCVDGKALHQPFAIHVRVEKCGDVRLELRNRFVGSERNLRLPALHGDAAVLGVDAGDDALRAHGGGQCGGELGVDCAFLGEKRRADDDALCARVEHLRARSME